MKADRPTRGQMNRRDFVQATVAGASALMLAPKAWAAPASQSGSTKKRPNLLFIMTDQQRYDAVGANGNGLIQTPNLDRLARGSVNLRQYYTNAPVCIPSRAVLFSGMYPGTVEGSLKPQRDINLFRVLKSEGYTLGYVGKNHLLTNDEFANFDYSDVSGFNHKSSGPVEDQVNSFAKSRKKDMEDRGCWAGAIFHDFPPEATQPYIEASSAIRFLTDVRRPDTPFCLCLSIEDPHVPHIALRKYEAVYPPEKMRLYPTTPDELDHKAKRFRLKWQAQGSDKATEQDRRHYMAVYYSMISWVDEQIGRVLEQLRKLGLEEDTIVVFTSDHGDFLFEHGMCKKDLVLLDSLLHVPLFISWPGHLKPAEVAGTMTEEVDVMPTLLDLMGVAIPPLVQGKSLAPVLRGEKTEHKDVVFAEVCQRTARNPYADYATFMTDWTKYHGQAGHLLSWSAPYNVPGDFTQMVRTRDYKYITYPNSGEEELYDLKNDPHEAVNLATAPQQAAVKNELKQRLATWDQRCTAPRSAEVGSAQQKKYSDWKTGPGKTDAAKE